MNATATLRAGLADLCAKCSGFMVPGIAMGQTLVGGAPDMGMVTMSAGGPGEIIACMRCRDCGWSVTSWHGIGGKPR